MGWKGEKGGGISLSVEERGILAILGGTRTRQVRILVLAVVCAVEGISRTGGSRKRKAHRLSHPRKIIQFPQADPKQQWVSQHFTAVFYFAGTIWWDLGSERHKHCAQQPIHTTSPYHGKKDDSLDYQEPVWE